MKDTKSKGDNLHKMDEAGKRLQAIIDTMIDGVITIDTDGVIESVNPAAAKLFGFMQEEVVGQKINMLMPNPHKHKHDSYIENYLKTREPKIIGIGREVEGMRKDGSVFPIRLAVSEVRLKDKTIFTGIIHDLSTVKEAEASLKKLNDKLESLVNERTIELEEVINKLLKVNEQLEHEVSERKHTQEILLQREEQLQESLEKEMELGELKSRFVSMASHEFRTPLSTILSSAALLKRYTQAEHQTRRDKHIDRIQSSVANLTGILNDFLSLSKLEEGKVEVLMEELEIGELCAEVTDEVQGLLKDGQQIFHEDRTEGKKIRVDRRILKNILFNLLSNAIKYSGEQKPIHCQAELNEAGLIIMIKDQGIGIPEAEQKHLFSRFFRASNSLNIQGTGLGLDIVRQYLTLLDGSIEFESGEHLGSTFTVTIPQQHEKDSSNRRQ